MLPDKASDSLVGFTLIDKYKVLRQIGRGGMGEVYEAEHVELAKRVAVKVMLGKYAEDNEAIARFRREALAASRIGNPHIIDVSDIGTTHDNRPFVVMELLSGAPLGNVIEMTGPMPAWRAVHIMRQVLRAVHAAHVKGIIHRDLKPDNIFLLDKEEQHDFVKLLDFGISKIIDLDASAAATKLTTTGVVMGTPLYMAPEQAMGMTTDHAADIYACGVMLYEMLAGRPPFDGATYAVLVAKLLTAPPQPLNELRPGLSPVLVRAVHRALEKEPQKRFPTADAFAAALPIERPPSGVELAATIDSGRQVVVPRPMVARKKPIWPWLAGGVALAAGATIGILLALGSDDKPKQVATTPAPIVTPIAPPAPPLPPPVDPTPKSARLKVQSTPPGATLTIDGQRIGETPIEHNVIPGKHHVHVELAGFVAVDQDTELAADEHGSLVAALQPAAKQVASPPAPPAHPPVVKLPPKPPDVKHVTEPPQNKTVDKQPPPLKVGPQLPPPQPPPQPPQPPPHNDPPGTKSKPNPYQ